jgi:hypothetical protein
MLGLNQMEGFDMMTVSEKIAAGAYETPPINYARTTRALARDAYNADVNQKMAQFKADLEAEYGMVGHPKADKLYAKAWDMGHSSGLNEVMYYYDDLSELVI